MVGSVSRRGGRVDIAINNAGIIDNAAAEDMTLALWRPMIDINVTGVVLCSQAAGRLMVAHGHGGSIVRVSLSGAHSIVSPLSLSGAHSIVSPRKQCHDNATTGGVTMRTISLVAEWAPHGVRPNAVRPSDVTAVPVASLEELQPPWQGRTPRTPLGQPHEIADASTFLAGPRAGVVTGRDWLVDGGYECWSWR